MVLDTSRDALVFFHAPCCEDCEAWGAALEALAASLRSRPDFAFAEVDGRSQGALALRFGVRTFPAVRMFPKADNSGAKAFLGDPCAEALRIFALGDFS